MQFRNGLEATALYYKVFIMEEIWKDIIGYELLYQVSNLWNVKSIKKLWWNWKRFYELKEYLLKPWLSIKKWYLSVALCKNWKPKTYMIHQLVAEHFIPWKQQWNIVNHKDTNKLNNAYSNLEWTTYTGNILHSYKMWTHSWKRKYKPRICLDCLYEYIPSWFMQERCTKCSKIQRNYLSHLRYIKLSSIFVKDRYISKYN